MKLIERLKSVIKTSEVEFLCEPEFFGNIPEPYPARKLIPNWFKNLPSFIDKKEKLTNSTIKRCAPFLDAMTIGWIIPLVADVEIMTNEDGSGIEYKWLFERTMVENHNLKQVENHPESPKPPIKFLNYWFIKLPKDYSALFVPPLNRPDPRFQCISGLVDDTYMGTDALEYVNFPFFFTQPNYTGLIKAGTPLVQLIPIKRDEVLAGCRKVKINKADKKTLQLVEKTRARRRSHESLYRDELWRKK